MALVQHDFGRALEIRDEHRFHLPGKPRVLDDDVELAIADPARDVQVRRVRRAPSGRRRPPSSRAAWSRSTRTRGCRPRAAAGSRRARSARSSGNVGRSGHEQPHVDAVGRGRPQRLHVGASSRRNRRRSATAFAAPSPRRADPREAGRPCSACRRRHAARPLRQRDGAALARSSSGSGSPAAAHESANASSRSATAGPRISMPVSRHGSTPRAGSPTQRLSDAQPGHEADGPSTAISLR